MLAALQPQNFVPFDEKRYLAAIKKSQSDLEHELHNLLLTYRIKAPQLSRVLEIQADLIQAGQAPALKYDSWASHLITRLVAIRESAESQPWPLSKEQMRSSDSASASSGAIVSCDSRNEEAKSSLTLDDIPQLSKESGEWVTQKVTATIEGRKTDTLTKERHGGVKDDKGLSGISTHDNAWRKESPNIKTIWYYKPSLSSKTVPASRIVTTQ
ncbi:MAG: hypothetical protein O7D91_08435 [Planctomycetota bacterium]|nr:hypothetical protein [Planctomycetota bacterium]